jgi:hypothetical protein
MAGFFLWCILFLLCWPLALLALVLYPIAWLVTLPFRLLGIAVQGVFALLSALFSCRFVCCAGRERSDWAASPFE